MSSPTVNGSSDQLLWKVLFSYLNLPALAIADEISLFDQLSSLGLSAQEVANNISSNATSTHDWLELLHAQGYLLCKEGRYFSSPLSDRFLKRESAEYWGGALQYGYLPFKRHCPIRSALWPRQNMSNLWQSLGVHQEKNSLFIKAMDAHSAFISLKLAKLKLLPPVKHLLDLGSGSARICRTWLEEDKTRRATFLDFPNQHKIALESFDFSQIKSQSAWIDGDFLTASWPLDVDGILLSNVLHHLDEKAFDTLLKRASAELKGLRHIIIIDAFRQHNMTLEVSAFALQLASLGANLWTLDRLLEILKNSNIHVGSTTELSEVFQLIVLEL